MNHWRKSSYSANASDCVEVGRGVGIRDSKTTGHLPFSTPAWTAFLTAAKSGTLDPLSRGRLRASASTTNK
jgi:hypothetical protein